MKKLMIGLVAASATIFAFGDLPSGTSFEAYATGGKTIAQLTDYEDDGVGTSGDRYWFYEGDTTAAIGVITNDTPNAPSRPAQFADDTNLKYLDLTASDATNVLYRAINSVSDESVVSVATLAGQSIDDGLYLDTLVKFTPGELTSLELGDGDKIALTYVEETDDEDGDGKVLSNIVVRAGYVNGSTVTPVNYVMNPISEFSAADWHRLTVRAINVGYADAPVGFVVYVDGVEVTYDLAQEPGDSAYLAALAGNSIVDNYLYNTEKHAFIPSAVNTGTAKTTLSAVGFKGNGCVDDISFTATPPTFIQEGTTVTIAWDDNVTSYTVATNGTPMVDGEAVSGEGSANLLIADGTTTITVTATYNDANLMDGTWTVSAGTLSAGVWTGFESGATLTIKSLYPYFQVGDAYYQEFAGVNGALAAAIAGGGVIKLNADYTGDIAFDTENVASVVIDLAGKTLTGDSDVAIHTGCANMIITNSTVEVGHVVAPEGGLAVILETDAVLSVYAGIFDGEIADDSGETAALTIYGGSFYDAAYVGDPTNDFYLKSFVEDGLTISEPVGGYFTVSSSVEPPAPTTYELTIPTVTGASATVTDKATSSVIADITAIEDGTVVTVTWTPESGYKITAGDSEEITMDDNKTAKSPTVVAITYATLTITPVENCTIVVSNATEEVATGATFDVDDAVELTVYRTPAEGYELDGYSATEQITMDQDRTVTAAVKSSGGSGWEPDPSKIDPSATAADTYPELDGTALATANAQKLTAWAAAKSIDFAAVTGGAATYVDAFLLNCAPDEVEAANADFKATITVNADGTVTVTAPGDYNVTPTIQGKQSLSDSEKWHTKAPGDKFFRAVLDL